MWNCPPSNILVPVDFGEASARAVAVAGALAARTGARVRLLHAESIEAPPYFTHEQIESLEKQRRSARAHAEKYLADFGRRQGLPDAEVVVQEGSPLSLIVEGARGVDLVIMGTHGRRGASRWWLGSVAERVVHESRTPVLVVRADSAGAPEEVFQRPLLVSSPGLQDGAGRRVAERLAGAFEGQVAARTATCEADLARERQASLIVVSRGEPGIGIATTNERWLRSCSLPMLFVPETPGV
jgi:nucleotide-binding universal stress UspA family protein